jgi:hypothetical protein
VTGTSRQKRRRRPAKLNAARKQQATGARVRPGAAGRRGGRPDLEPFFLNLLAHSEAWRGRGHELTSFLVPNVREQYERWLLARTHAAAESGSDAEHCGTSDEEVRGAQHQQPPPETVHSTRQSRCVASAIFKKLQGEFRAA